MRSLALTALLFALTGCAGLFDSGARPATPAARFAAALEAGDTAVEAGIDGMDAFERRAGREDAAVAFALGRGAALPAAGPGAAEAAGAVIGPAFTALGDYAHVLGQAAEGARIEPRPSPGAAVLAAAAMRALPATRATIPGPEREAGIAAIAALARLPAQAEARRRPDPSSLAAEAQPHVAAVARLLRMVIGTQPTQATQGAIADRRAALEAAHARLLQAARADRSLGPAGRYALFHQIAALRDADPLPETLDAMVTLLDAMDAAHAAIAAGAADASPRVAAFESAVAELSALVAEAPEATGTE
jgi:hypothetical protein